MAVYTDVGDDELAQFIDTYGIGPVVSFKGIAEGVENSNYLLKTATGTYILTLYEKRVDAADLPFFLGLMEHLAERGISCPLPLKSTSGQAIGQLAGRPAAIVTFLEGIWHRHPTAVHTKALGAALARFHLAGADFAIPRANALGPAGWRPLFERCAMRANEVAPRLAEEIAGELDFFDRTWPVGLPAGVIHADLFPDNVFFLGDQLSGLIDFYFACNDMLVYDLGICLNSWCFEPDGSYNYTKGRAMLAAYDAVRPLSAEEWQALPLLCRGSALRFLLTRLYDWLNVPPGALVRPKDPLEYRVKLAFHRTIRSARDYGVDFGAGRE
ncbi:MAG: homoserine kinase [Ancalomicrobiaceae bacterium]|nr:homoserine kinase [Ancalomicrobiaceae bacterium]